MLQATKHKQPTVSSKSKQNEQQQKQQQQQSPPQPTSDQQKRNLKRPEAPGTSDEETDDE